MQSVHAEGPPRLVGAIVDVEMTEAHPNSLGGRIVTVGAEDPAGSRGADSHSASMGACA